MTDFDDLESPREPWYIEPKDKLPASELQRQQAFVNFMAVNAPAVDVTAIPNAGKSTDWQRIQRWKEGARAGALDLIITWRPTRPGDRGIFFAEFKNGKTMPTPSQAERLDRYFRMGHGCGVYRSGAKLVEHLRAQGAPFLW